MIILRAKLLGKADEDFGKSDYIINAYKKGKYDMGLI
jgi:hypothetical protein